jgi:hypothetical protein
LNSLAYRYGQLCAGVHLVYGIRYVGFSQRWLVSLMRGGDIQEQACKAVSYSYGQLCAGVHFVYGISNVGFSLVSLMRGGNIKKPAYRTVRC